MNDHYCYYYCGCPDHYWTRYYKNYYDLNEEVTLGCMDLNTGYKPVSKALGNNLMEKMFVWAMGQHTDDDDDELMMQDGKKDPCDSLLGTSVGGQQKGEQISGGGRLSMP